MKLGLSGDEWLYIALYELIVIFDGEIVWKQEEHPFVAVQIRMLERWKSNNKPWALPTIY